MSVQGKPSLSLRMKLHVLLDEGIGLVREARELVRIQKGWRVDLWGPRGTEIRFEQERDPDFFVPRG